MKHVVTAAPLRQSVLVTGFGAFPGAPRNPTAAVLKRLERDRGRLRRLGIGLNCVLIPVVFDEIETVLARAVAAHRPDAILHLGLAGRRRYLSVETRAINRANPLHPDAKGQLPPSQSLVPGGSPNLAATYPAASILAAIRRQGLSARLSIDAGDYVCNATLYRSLADRAAAHVGFLHVPKTRPSMQPKARVVPLPHKGEGRRDKRFGLKSSGSKPTIDKLTRATLAAVLIMARRSAARRGAAVEGGPKVPRKGDAARDR